MDFQQEALLTLMGGPDMVQGIKSAEATSSFTRLPIKGPRESMEKLGFVFGKVLDDLFIAVVAPAGWSLKHKESYHSYIYDEQGRERGYMFYKGAFYDREAFYRLSNRYYSEYDAEPMPDMVKAERWCRMGKERGYDVVSEIMPENFKPPKRKMVFDEDYYNGNFGWHRTRAINTLEGPEYKRQKVDVYVTEPKIYSERLHRYLAKDRATGEVLHTGEWIKNGDYSPEAKAKEQSVIDWIGTNFPDYTDEHAYW